MKPRNVSSASLSPEAKRRLTAVAKELGMKQQVLFGRLLDWFQAQDRMLQLILVKLIPEGATIYGGVVLWALAGIWATVERMADGRPEAGGRRPEAGGLRPEAGGLRPEEGGRRREG